MFTDRQSAERLAVQAEEAKTLLEAYNERLAAELENRKNTAKQLRRYINDQNEALTNSEKSLQVCALHANTTVCKINVVAIMDHQT